MSMIENKSKEHRRRKNNKKKQNKRQMFEKGVNDIQQV